MTLNTDTDIYVHSQDHFYHPTTTAKVSVSIGQLMFSESIRVSFWILYLGSTARVTLSQNQIRLLDGCQEENNFDECIDQKLGDVLVKEINCTVPWLSRKKNICKVCIQTIK